MVNLKQCCRCWYWKMYGAALGPHCSYLLETGVSRLAQMTPEQRESGECPCFTKRTRKKRSAESLNPAGQPTGGGVNYRRVCQFYLLGMNDTQIAEAAGCSRTAVYAWRTAYGLPPNHSKKGGEESDTERDEM